MPYTVIKNKQATHETGCCLEAILAKYNDMYKYNVYIAVGMVFVVVKDEQPSYWEHGWAE